MNMPIPLYHGTSTLFLSDILKFGLAGKSNPIKDLCVREFAAAILLLAKKHLSQNRNFFRIADSFSAMVEQKSAIWNFQHGDTYLHASSVKAVGHAVAHKYGSEILSHSLIILEELVLSLPREDVRKLHKSYPVFFKLLHLRPAPLLITLEAVPIKDLLDEHGVALPSNHTQELLQDIEECLIEGFVQQRYAYRLIQKFRAKRIELIGVEYRDVFPPDACPLHQLVIGA